MSSNLNRKKFDSLIEKLLNKEIKCDEIIDHLNKNRIRCLNNSNNNCKVDVLVDIMLNSSIKV
jgi:hypothetical protein